MTMLSLRVSFVAVVLVALGAAGCVEEGVAESAGDVESPLAAEKAGSGDEAPGPRMRRGHGPRGPESLLRVALRELELSDAQRAAIDEALADMPRPEPPQRPDGAALETLAAGVRAGKVDVAAVVAQLGEPPDLAAQRQALADALATLHATLTPEQRRELVDHLLAELEEQAPRERGPRGHADKKMRGKGKPMGDPLGHLLADLDLSEAQRDAVAQALEEQRPDHAAMKDGFEAVRAAMRAKLESFASVSFDAAAFAAPPEGAPARGPREHLERMARAMGAIAPLLDAEQREALAARLERGPERAAKR
jgi:Spy/CpxP family protein refolding chaperone